MFSPMSTDVHQFSPYVKRYWNTTCSPLCPPPFTMFPPVLREESSPTCPIFESCPNFKMSRVPKCHPNLYIYTYVYISTTKRCTCPIFSPKFHPFPARLGTAGASRRRDLEQCGGRRESQQWWSPMGAESWVARHEGLRNDNEWIITIHIMIYRYDT